MNGIARRGCVAAKMLRRGTGRTPPFILVGLLLVVLILAFNCWTLSSQNSDLQQEIEKIQAEVKISAVKQEQSEKKNAALGETVHEMEELSGKLKQKLKEEDDALSKADKANREKSYEITSLKNQVAKFEEQILSLTQQVEEREVELSKAKETNTHLASERDDAVEAIAEKDTLINTLKRQLEQEKSRSSSLQYSVDDLQKKLTQSFGDLTECQDKVAEIESSLKAQEAKEVKAQKEVAAVRKEKMAVAKPEMVPGAMNLPGIHNKENEADAGVLANPQAIVPQHVADNHGNGQAAGPAVMERPAPPVANNNLPIQPPEGIEGESNHNNLLANNNGPAVVERPNPPVGNAPIQAPEHPPEGEGQQVVNDVLAPPPQHLDDNLDAAIDEEEKIVEDLMDDQDEEGNEVKRNNEEILDEDNALEDLKDHPRVGNLVGGLKVPLGFRPEEANPQDMNMEEDIIGNQGNYYDGNIDNNNIRNLQRPPEFH